MFGRQAERERLREASHAAFRGEVRIVGISGPAGIGKSTLLADLTLDGCTTLRAVGHEASTHVPWAGAHQLLYPLLGDLPDVPAPQRAALEHV
ncbi:MAG: LuxR family transcriptional regulator, partial [Ilumatobacteraceae bacterium]|nr:LuxR family transcriptional regulator [Ilumatobacteraceae bacterium]